MSFMPNHACTAQKFLNYLNWLNIKVVKCFVHTQ